MNLDFSGQNSADLDWALLCNAEPLLVLPIGDISLEALQSFVNEERENRSSEEVTTEGKSGSDPLRDDDLLLAHKLELAG